ncbi:hypothetical protein PENFLA_c027G10004 [Penicillium flavigenum]|uniref:Uncharacterized protein n=1 Tax=Penicillium flavigenum TaxID=254877 RepID=A0A1V6SR90_9EURO|nr:hypothetical protein PENFLA_c027G10004 [Penicillium flavigenum]
MDSDSDELLNVIQITQELGFCPNRVWAVAGENLQRLVPDSILTMGTGDKLDKCGNPNKHDECTPSFCEYSQRDFTSVRQRHECKEAQCMQLRGRFSRVTLERAALVGKSTVWNLAGDSMIEYPHPYMAISHVWSDGTGTGAWKDGDVNECLYTFFQDIAKQFQCVGIWWDTLCIPREKVARIKAIRQIQRSYEDARITLVHDCFLRNWEWSPTTACFAILMSPWFSRGWTALELAKSRKVKVIFKGSFGPVIKDLDEDILAVEGEPDGPRKEASRIIWSLRRDFTTLNDLLTVLRSRFTSWPKDIATISALLVGVIPHELQQNTYKSILKKIGRLSHGHLFHNAVTMSKGFSWCPTTLFDMPLDFSEASLRILGDGDVYGIWRVVPVIAGFEFKKMCRWDSTHPLIRRQLQNNLRCPEKCQFLAECGTTQVRRALLVKKLQEKSRYQYIGAIHFHQDLIVESGKERIVTITSDQYQGRAAPDHWGNVLTRGDRGDGPHLNIKRRRESQSDTASKAEMLRRATWRGDYRMFKDVVERASLGVPDQLGRLPLHLAAERGHRQMVQDIVSHKVDLNARCNNGQTALHRAAWGGSPAVLKLLQNRSDEFMKDNNGNTALHLAAQMGFASIAKLLINERTIDMGGCNNLTPLHFAAMGGYEEVAQLLKYANLEARDNKIGWTPLHCAADNGNQKLVKLLIERGAEVNAKDDQVGWTPLHFAAMNGHKAVVDILLKKGAKNFAKDKYGWTPGQFAEINRHTVVMTLLPGNDVNAIFSNKDHWTPLHCRAINNQPGLVKLLVGNGADLYLNKKVKTWTPLQFAAESGLGTTIRRLLEKSGDVQSVDFQTLLHHAAERGYEELTRSLLEAGAPKEAEALDSWTPLHRAAQHGHKAVTQLLVDAGANKEVQTTDGRTPLHYAAKHGHEEIVWLLLEAGANKEAKAWSLNGYTPLHDSATSGHELVTRLLLKAGADKEAQAQNDQTPLHYAVASGHDAIVRLLARASANIEARTTDGQTPLHYAAKHGHERIVWLLLESGANKEARAWRLNSFTPLHNAVTSGHEIIVRLLLKAGADKEAKIQGGYKDGYTPLHQAAATGHGVITRLLLEAAANKEAKARDGQTPLHCAVARGHEFITWLLLDSGANKEEKDRSDWTPLYRASIGGHEAVARLLLNAGADKEAKVRDDHTPLHGAVIGGHEVIVRLLLETGVDKGAKARGGQSPLHFAAEHGHKAIVRLLKPTVMDGTSLEQS